MSSPYRSGEAKEPASPWVFVDQVLSPNQNGMISEFTDRRRVPGGWLYRVTQFSSAQKHVNIVFVPFDPNP